MEKWKVQAVKREGFNGVWRAGRFWPSENAVEVEVLDDDDAPDPQIEVDDAKVPGGKRKALSPGRLSRASFEKLLKDGHLSKFRIGDLEAATNEQALRAQVRSLEGDLAMAESEIRRLQEALSARFSETDEVRARTIESGHLEAHAGALEEAVAKAPPAPPPAPVPEQPPAEKPSLAAEKAASQAHATKARHK